MEETIDDFRVMDETGFDMLQTTRDCIREAVEEEQARRGGGPMTDEEKRAFIATPEGVLRYLELYRSKMMSNTEFVRAVNENANLVQTGTEITQAVSTEEFVSRFADATSERFAADKEPDPDSKSG